MTQYETADLLTNLVNGGTPVLALLITIITAYLVVAWSVGRQLTKSQVTLINVVFLVFGPLLILGWARRFQIALRLQEELRLMDAGIVGAISPSLITGVAFAFLFLIMACIKFMWDVRHPKD